MIWPLRYPDGALVTLETGVAVAPLPGETLVLRLGDLGEDQRPAVRSYVVARREWEFINLGPMSDVEAGPPFVPGVAHAVLWLVPADPEPPQPRPST